MLTLLQVVFKINVEAFSSYVSNIYIFANIYLYSIVFFFSLLGKLSGNMLSLYL